VKLLLDENLSHRLVAAISSAFPGSQHVRDLGLSSASDTEVWRYAKQHGFTIVSKDADFRQRSILHGAPPKVIGLLVGNVSTEETERLLRSSERMIAAFEADASATFLELP